MNPYYPIYTEKAECQDCYKCVRQCPTKAITVRNGKASVIEERCVLCGNCVQVCPVGAKHVRNDLQRAKRLLTTKEKVIVSLAPSFISEFRDISKSQLIAAIKALGFYGVSETALGAQEVSAHIAHSMEKDEPRLYVSSACPTVVQMIKKHYPQHADVVTDLYSPLLAHCAMLRQEYGEDIGILFFGPCIAKKAEADGYETLLDLAVTFKGLRAWWAEEGIDPAQMPDHPENVFIPRQAQEGALYPIDGGMISSIKANCTYNDSSCMSFSGMEEIENILENLDTFPKSPLFLELLACKGGCVNGPHMTDKTSTALKRLSILDYAAVPQNEFPRQPSCNINNRFEFTPVQNISFEEAKIRDTLHDIGKYSATDELNCSGCGYDSCRDFAVAILAGKAEKDMCVSYMRELAHKKANALIKAMPSGVVIVDEKLHVVECNRNFSRLLGSDIEMAFEAKPGMRGANLAKLIDFSSYFQTVLNTGDDILNKNIQNGDTVLNVSIFSIEQHRIVGGIIQDITAPAMHKEQIISKTQEVIEKNLATVQKIAYLLGENASETEVLLDSITQSFRVESVRK